MQDPNDGLIKPVKLEEVPKKLVRGWHGPFQVGELLPWKGTWFEVEVITDTQLVLKVRKPIDEDS